MSSRNSNSNEDSEQQVVPDGPQMRSVSIMSAPAVPVMPLRTTKRHEPLAKTPPPSATKSAAWTVQNAPPLPSIYLLERTHAHVDALSSQVSARIADCLYQRSIALRSDPNESAVMHASTSDLVRFSIRLWSAQDQTLVEIQRTDGCSRAFHETAKHLLRAARGQTHRPLSPPRCVPAAVRESLDRDPGTQEAIDIAVDMLNQPNRPDLEIMGLESLAQITNSPDCQVYAAKTILNGAVGLKLIQILETPVNPAGMEHEHRHEHRLKFQALSVLSNALTALEASGDVGPLLAARPEFTRSPLLQSLVTAVDTCHTACPHAATQAARILHVLIAAGPRCCKSRACNLQSAIQQALSCRHANLEAACQKLSLQL